MKWNKENLWRKKKKWKKKQKSVNEKNLKRRVKNLTSLKKFFGLFFIYPTTIWRGKQWSKRKSVNRKINSGNIKVICEKLTGSKTLSSLKKKFFGFFFSLSTSFWTRKHSADDLGGHTRSKNSSSQERLLRVFFLSWQKWQMAIFDILLIFLEEAKKFAIIKPNFP